MAQWEVENPTTGEVYVFSSEPTDADIMEAMGLTPQAPMPEQSTMGKVGSFLKGNMELPMGIGGALTGAAAGTAIAPGVGTIVGGVLGGMVGSAGGSLTSDILADRPLDYAEAAKEAAISGGIDAATLGAGKVLRPLASAFGGTIDDIYRTFVPRTIPTPTGAPTVGTLESLQQTQGLLAAGGGSLSALQTNRAGRFRRLAEQLGDIGIFSGARSRQRIQQNANILKEEVQRQIDGLDPALTMSSGGLGENILDIISTGKQANSTIYTQNLDAITAKYGSKSAPAANIRNTLVRFRNDNTREFGSTLTDATQGQLDSLIDSLEGVRTMTVGSMMAFQKKLNATLSQISDVRNASMYNGTAAAELAEMSAGVRTAISDSLGWVDPQLQASFSAMNRSFGEAAESLLPKLTQGIVTRADKGAYEALGNAILTNNSTSQIRALMNSVDEAFSLANKAGTPITGAIKTADEAKAAIRQSYIQNIFADVAGGEDIYKAGFKNLADKFENKTVAEKAQAVLGSGYPEFKRLLNAISDASHTSDSSLFGLMLRSREYTAAQGALTLGGAGAGATLGLPAAAAVFAVPEVLSRIATNKNAVNRLLFLNAASKRPNMTPEVLGALSAKVFEALNPAELEDIKGYFTVQTE
jgi:hypothetical protein